MKNGLNLVTRFLFVGNSAKSWLRSFMNYCFYVMYILANYNLNLVKIHRHKQAGRNICNDMFDVYSWLKLEVSMCQSIMKRLWNISWVYYIWIWLQLGGNNISSVSNDQMYYKLFGEVFYGLFLGICRLQCITFCWNADQWLIFFACVYEIFRRICLCLSQISCFILIHQFMHTSECERVLVRIDNNNIWRIQHTSVDMISK